MLSLQNKVKTLALYADMHHEQGDTIDLDFIDEIYFSSPTSVKIFKTCYHGIPENIRVTTANETTDTEYRKLFRDCVHTI